MTAGDIRILRTDLAKDPLPQRMSVLHRVALVSHADRAPAARPRDVERMSNDPVHALVRVDLFLDGDLVDGAGLEPSAHANVETLGVFPEHDEVDVGRRAVLQRAKPRIE